MTSFQRESYLLLPSFVVSVLGTAMLVQGCINIASTSLLFEGDSAGDPPVTKHLFIATIPTWSSLFLNANRPVDVVFLN